MFFKSSFGLKILRFRIHRSSCRVLNWYNVSVAVLNYYYKERNNCITVADQGYSKRGVRQPIILVNFSQKVHKNEKKLNRKGRGSESLASLGSANVLIPV